MACATPSTRPSIERTERARLPAQSAELTRTETLKPLSAAPSGELMTIDKGIFAELVERLAEAAAAVARLNSRVVASRTERRCIEAIWQAGVAPADCPRD
jgi:hypothetical protein